VEACVPMFHDRATWDEVRRHITDPTDQARQPTAGEMRRSDGSILTYLTHPLPDGNTLIAFADVTATRRVESALRERAEAFQAADRLKTEFVQNVSYQLRSPLTTILGYAEFLQSQRHGDLSQRQTDYVNAILQASDHLSKLIENILDLAMIEAGRMDLDLTDVNFADLVGQSVEMVISKAEDTEVSVRADIDGDLGIIRADEGRLRQVLFNLVSNALRFSEAGGEVIVSARRTGEMATITVTDTGKGMDAERRASSFDSFTSGDQRGAGLGLALVHRFIDLHGGNVGIKENPGGGTIVTCWLPVEARVETRPLDVSGRISAQA
jgi:signal transduction histidine kinase